MANYGKMVAIVRDFQQLNVNKSFVPMLVKVMLASQPNVREVGETKSKIIRNSLQRKTQKARKLNVL